MNNVIEILNLRKEYKNFLLDNISFSVPGGFVCGFIGENGAGKTTTLKLILGMIRKDGGSIKLFGKTADDVSLKEDIGVLFEQPYYQEDWTPIDVEKSMHPFYKKWSSNAFHQYLERFSLDPKQKYKTMSRGMKMKLGMAVTLAHDAKLLLLDEPTSGLDPVGREEMLEILRDYMVEEDRTIFFSTHITSDLEKIADYITYIQSGKILYSGLKDELIEKYCLVKGGTEDLPQSKRKQAFGLREYPGGFDGMIEIKDIAGFPASVITETVSLDDIMVRMSKGVEI
ncbi:ABC transporter ATP-binding protein [Mediterraneibacter glycyrrhizinilyticus]|uniref:ABC transporter ATP-binding protein n=1 Tax=Mediterraneibacter glycyrrhizinilyticus TaxID=342942 RepID=UPI00265B0440|nr:ABC transporter ATP-binding protein [Mediterraneibacter glycyrrhizinilyticus]MCF2569396.1 ABC transporter ATP-binding protein [Mediterraneibacter glycyrrhizinilyticus]